MSEQQSTELTSFLPHQISALMSWFEENNLTPYVLVDATVPSVVVPPQFVQDGKIVLNVSMRSTRNLFVTQDGFSFDSRFNGASMRISFPIHAVLEIYSREIPELGNSYTWRNVKTQEHQHNGTGNAPQVADPVTTDAKDAPPQETTGGRPSFLSVVK